MSKQIQCVPGMNPAELRGSRVAVFVGCCFDESEKNLLCDKLPSNESGLIGCSHGILASRVGQWLGVTGPTYAIDTACSSSIYALEHAFKAIRNGDCEAAVVCGINICLHPCVSLQFSRMGILSPDGKSKSFDISANGYARSEAAVVCLLQKLKDSRRAYAQIIYSKTNCDGFKDNGITYPSGKIQKRLIKEFYEECDIPANSVQYVEAHGTGTTVGDVEELNAIDAVMSEGRTSPLLIGSVKSNIGHTEGASGLCSAVKICIAYHSGYIPPNMHYNLPREGIPGLTNGRLKVITEKEAWNRGLASLSGFGFGGANAHILLKNFNKQKINNGTNDNLPHLVCVSGRTKSAVELILNSLEANIVDVEAVRLWHAIHENNIEGHVFRGFVLLKSTPTGNVTLGRDILSYRNVRRPVCLVYSDACWQKLAIENLMNIPEFSSAIHKCNAALKSKKVNLFNIMAENSSVSDNDLYSCITTTALHIGLTDLLKNIDVNPDVFLGYGIGALGYGYAKGTLTLEEAMDASYYQGLTNMQDGKTANGSSKEKRPLTAADVVPLIPINAVIIQTTPDNNLQFILNNLFKNVVQINLIKKKNVNVIQDLFIGLGRLYEAGVNMKIAKLYPSVQFPVSQGTPMLSHLVEWDHREDWYKDSFVDNRPKLSSVERDVTISLDNPDFDYLHGHYIGGRHLYPGSGYLLLVWETLAMMHAREYKQFSVVFKNVQFLRATTIPKKGELVFNITIQPVSGAFEVTENKVAVVTGIIQPKNNIITTYDEVPSSNNYKDLKEIRLSQKDFYREIKLRGYDHSGMFKGVIDSSIDGSNSRVNWINNWIVFIDYVFQVLILKRDTRNLYVPTSCAELSIDTDLHYKTITTNNSLFNQPYLDVFIDKGTQVARSGGLEIRDFEATVVSKKADLNVPIFKTYNFIPNEVKEIVKFEEIIRCNAELIIENTQVHKFKAVEVIDNEYKMKTTRPILEEIRKVLEDIPQLWPELHTVTNDETHKDRSIVPADKSAVLLVGTNLSQKEQVLREYVPCLREGGFIMSREEYGTKVIRFGDDFDVITVKNTGDETLVLLKPKIRVEQKKIIKIDTFDQTFSWIDKVKEYLEKHIKIVLHAHDELSGILGLVNCLRREPNGENIQCFLIIDSDAPPFDPELQFYKDQLDKDLAFNIFKDGKWGTYRHLVINNIEIVKPLPHAYINIDTIGDLSTTKWFEGSIEDSVQERDDNFKFIHVYCSALNFRDIVTATGRVSVDSVARGRLAQECVQGFEFAGKLKNGIRVVGMAEQAISNVLYCNKYLMMPIPDEWTFQEAASVMVAYSTVYIAFDVLGKMKAGESVLIHAGSGGVGQAAINVALNRGCEVFTTVGTPEKVNFIKKLYPQLKDTHIGNSRDTSFEQLVMKETRGKGVDIVLNSLSEDKLLASIRCLGRKGRFLEIGKYDIFKNTPVEMSFHKKEISFHGVMLDYVFDNVDDGKKLIELVSKGITKGEVRPITHCTFEKYDIEAAYRYMASGKHVGKVIIEIRKEEDKNHVKPTPVLVDAHRRYVCRKDYVYVIVGGLGGFGLELTDWLVLRGARKFVLVSSKGVSTGYQARRIKTWTSYGVDVRVLTDDVSTESGCEKILDVALSMGHVEGIFNLAGVLNDGIFLQQSPEMFRNSFKPKALAALYLDKLSKRMCPSLRDFVLFSSIACGQGNAGQSNYGLANSVMERICEQRRKDCLPGLAIQWGAIGDVGMLAELQSESGESEVGGIMPQRIHSCLRALDILLMQENAIVSSYVLAQKKSVTDDKKSAVETVAQLIGVKNLKTVSYQVSLAELGMDSITALEVKQTLERDFDIVLAAQDVRTLTFAKLMSLTVNEQESDTNAISTVDQIKGESQEDWVFDLGYFLRNFGEEEDALKPYILMPSILPNVESLDVPLAKTLFMIPGLEGCATTLQPLCRRLHTKTCILQLPFDGEVYDLQNLVEKLYSTMKPMYNHETPFSLLGYSYGTIPVLELAAKLESEGHYGTVFCVDGSPTWIRSLIESRLGFADDIKIQNYVLKHVFETTIPNNNIIEKVLEETTELDNYNDKIDYIIKHLPVDFKYSNDFIKKMSYACTNRIKIVKDYNLDVIAKIKSPIILLRPKYGIIKIFTENYDLDKFTEGEVEVQYLNGNHVTILEDPNCVAIIKKHLNNL